MQSSTEQNVVKLWLCNVAEWWGLGELWQFWTSKKEMLHEGAWKLREVPVMNNSE